MKSRLSITIGERDDHAIYNVQGDRALLVQATAQAMIDNEGMRDLMIASIVFFLRVRPEELDLIIKALEVYHKKDGK